VTIGEERQPVGPIVEQPDRLVRLRAGPDEAPMLAGDFKAVSTDEKAELAAEIERRRPGTPERIKEARRQALEKNWLQNGSAKDSSGNWTVPEDLIWRSLPRGEDR
jgi:hypothetical protein